MTRRQFLNDPDDFVHEALEGLVLAHPSLVLHTDPSYVRRAARGAPKVALVSGGGSGHEPLHSGFVGTGMLDAAVPGAVFASPTAFQVTVATKAADFGHGVLQIVKNYTGDEDGPGRRGTGATLVVEKVCGAAAEAGVTLEELAVLGRHTVLRSRPMAVALSGATRPGSAVPSFDLPDDEVDLGVGIHGERSGSRGRRHVQPQIGRQLGVRVGGQYLR